MSVTCESLRVVHAHPGVLFALDWPGRWLPVFLGSGLAGWLAGILGLTGLFPIGPAAGLIVLGCGAMLIAPLLMLRGSWLAIDLERGWIHWRRRWGRRFSIDSFSTNRLDRLSIQRGPSAIPFISKWGVILNIDHPRLREVALGWHLRRRTALRRARAIAAGLNLPLAGDPEPRVTMPPTDPIGWTFDRRFGQPAPPPEVIAETDGPDMGLVLPNLTGLTLDGGAFLGYALVWCLWSWTSLALQLRWATTAAGGEPGRWIAIVLLGGVALAGIGLLHDAVVRLVGWQSLARTPRGWSFARRWLGRDWRRRPLAIGTGIWIRRVDHPADRTGLWLPDRGAELQLAPGHNSETLIWLLKTLQRPLPECATGRLDAYGRTTLAAVPTIPVSLAE